MEYGENPLRPHLNPLSSIDLPMPRETPTWVGASEMIEILALHRSWDMFHGL